MPPHLVSEIESVKWFIHGHAHINVPLFIKRWNHNIMSHCDSNGVDAHLQNTNLLSNLPFNNIDNSGNEIYIKKQVMVALSAVLARIKMVPFFATLTSKSHIDILKHVERKVVLSGEVIDVTSQKSLSQKHDVSKCYTCFIIISGSIQRARKSPEVEDHSIDDNCIWSDVDQSYFNEKVLFAPNPGDLDLVEAQKYRCSIKSSSFAELAVITKHDFDEVLKSAAVSQINSTKETRPGDKKPQRIPEKNNCSIQLASKSDRYEHPDAKFRIKACKSEFTRYLTTPSPTLSNGKQTPSKEQTCSTVRASPSPRIALAHAKLTDDQAHNMDESGNSTKKKSGFSKHLGLPSNRRCGEAIGVNYEDAIARNLEDAKLFYQKSKSMKKECSPKVNEQHKCEDGYVDDVDQTSLDGRVKKVGLSHFPAEMQERLAGLNFLPARSQQMELPTVKLHVMPPVWLPSITIDLANVIPAFPKLNELPWPQISAIHSKHKGSRKRQPMYEDEGIGCLVPAPPFYARELFVRRKKLCYLVASDIMMKHV